MNRREKAYISISILLLIILIFKSVYLDDYNPQNKEEELYKEFAYRMAVEQAPGIFEKNKLRTFRVVNIKKIEEESISVISTYNKEKDEFENIEIEGVYKAKVRKYILGVMPYGEFSVLSRE